jgi:hypothetical protein
VTDVTGKASWNAAMTIVSQNMIWANYGSSQGFDTDDGSSWYNISNNFMYQADGYKMDFGGHDTLVDDNIFYKFKGDGQNCINTWPFLRDHGTSYSGNKCVLPESHNIGSVNGCDCPGDGTPGIVHHTAYTMPGTVYSCTVVMVYREPVGRAVRSELQR